MVDETFDKDEDIKLLLNLFKALILSRAFTITNLKVLGL